MAREQFNFVMLMITTLLLSVIWYWASRRGKKPAEPTLWPVLGMLPAVLLNLRRVHDYATEILTQCGGTFKFVGPWFCNLDMLVTSDPANIHHVFSRNFSNYPKGPEFRKIFDILGDGIFGADFELWEIHRRTTLAQLSRPDFYRYLERAVWDKVETALIPVLDHFSGHVDLQDIFQRFTFDNICSFVLGSDPCTLCVEMPHVPCEKAFSVVAEPLLHRHVLPEWMWTLQKWLNVAGERKLQEASRAFDEFVYPRIAAWEKNSKLNDDDGMNVLKAFDKAYTEKNDIIAAATRNKSMRGFLKDTSVSLILAGRDTTSTCLTWLFWLLAQNPSALLKIREEIHDLLNKTSNSTWRRFTAEESHELVYLHGALCESLRLFPPVAMEHKAPVKADILPSGHYLDKDAKLIISLYSVGRMETVWGKDCLEFKPERWVSPAGKVKHEPSYKFPAFNAGPRTCLGKEMAFVQMKMVAAAIIYHYNIKLVEGHPVSPRDSIILHAKHGLMVCLSKTAEA